LDDHGSRVSDAVWSLYGQAVRLFGAVPTLIEWDNEVPLIDVLLKEAERAQSILDHATTEATHADAA
jgi:uncharacterized protein (UPF0276 family)